MTFLPDGRLVVRASVQIKKGELVTRSLVEVVFITMMMFFFVFFMEMMIVMLIFMTLMAITLRMIVR